MTINKRGISSKQLERELRVTYKTAWYIHKRMDGTYKAACKAICIYQAKNPPGIIKQKNRRKERLENEETC